MELGSPRGCEGSEHIDHVLLALVAVRVAVLLTGAFLTLSLFQKFLKSPRSKDHLLLASGFGLMTIGALVEGVLFELLRLTLVEVHTVEAGFTAGGFAAILLAVHLSSQ